MTRERWLQSILFNAGREIVKRLRVFIQNCRQLVVFAIGIVLCMIIAVPGFTQVTRSSQVAGVDNSRMGAYRALAQLSVQAFQKGDVNTAAELARILERTWDRGEETGGEDSLHERNPDLFEKIDDAMDAFVKPLIHADKNAPESNAVIAAYKEFVSQLANAD